jgi:hypothetical protein
MSMNFNAAIDKVKTEEPDSVTDAQALRIAYQRGYINETIDCVPCRKIKKTTKKFLGFLFGTTPEPQPLEKLKNVTFGNIKEGDILMYDIKKEEVVAKPQDTLPIAPLKHVQITKQDLKDAYERGYIDGQFTSQSLR